MIKTTLERSDIPVQLDIGMAGFKSSVQIQIVIWDIPAKSINCTDYREMITPEWAKRSPRVNTMDKESIEIIFGCEYYRVERIKRVLAYILTYSDIYIAGELNRSTIPLEIEEEIKKMETFSGEDNS